MKDRSRTVLWTGVASLPETGGRSASELGPAGGFEHRASGPVRRLMRPGDRGPMELVSSSSTRRMTVQTSRFLQGQRQ